MFVLSTKRKDIQFTFTDGEIFTLNKLKSAISDIFLKHVLNMSL